MEVGKTGFHHGCWAFSVLSPHPPSSFGAAGVGGWIKGDTALILLARLLLYLQPPVSVCRASCGQFEGSQRSFPLTLRGGDGRVEARPLSKSGAELRTEVVPQFQGSFLLTPVPPAFLSPLSPPPRHLGDSGGGEPWASQRQAGPRRRALPCRSAQAPS